MLYTLVPPRTDPLGEDNHLIFTAGPANGTNLPLASKQNLNTKSPLTDIYLYGICGGTLSHQMKAAGFWAIDIKGIADSPTFIVINNEKVEFKDATPLWGMETAEAQQAMRDLTGAGGEQIFDKRNWHINGLSLSGIYTSEGISLKTSSIPLCPCSMPPRRLLAAEI